MLNISLFVNMFWFRRRIEKEGRGQKNEEGEWTAMVMRGIGKGRELDAEQGWERSWGERDGRQD